MGKMEWAMGLALAWAMAGCGKSEVRFERVDSDDAQGAKAPTRVGESDTSAAKATSEAGETLTESAARCRDDGAAACERLLGRRGEVEAAASPLTRQAWLEALAQGCIRAPSQAVCDGALGVLYRWRSEGVDPVPVVALMERACEDGIAAGCVMAANRYSREGTELEPHRHQGTRLFERACKLGSQPACARAAAGYLHEAEHFADEARRAQAVELSREPCTTGDVDACTVLAEATISPALPEEKRDYAEALRLVKEACEGGWARACNHQADLLLLGLGGEKDVPAGVARLGRTCERAENDEATGYACTALAFLHAGRSDLLPVDPEAAHRFAKRACEVRSKRLTEPCTVQHEVDELLGAARP